MVFFIAKIPNFSISWTFASRMRTVTKFTLFYKVSCVLLVRVMTRLIQFPFKYLINVSGRLRSEILWACLHVSSASWPALIALDRVRLNSWKNLSYRELSLVPYTTISLIRESWRLSDSHLELNFFNLVTKSWKFWPSCCLYVKNLWCRMVVFFLGLISGFNLTFQKGFVSYHNRNNHKTDPTCCQPWSSEEKNVSF